MINYFNIINQERKHLKVNEKQVNLDGQELNNNVSVIDLVCQKGDTWKIFGLKDSIWETLIYVYNTEIYYKRGVTTKELMKIHNAYFPIHIQTLRTNLNRAVMRSVIKKNTGAGNTKRMNIYEITPYGREIIEKFMSKKMEIGGDDEIYVIQEEGGGYVKIGISKNPEKRLIGIQNGNPRRLKIVKRYKGYNENQESILHQYYKKYHILNEWFSEDILKDIDETIKNLFKSGDVLREKYYGQSRK